MRFIRKNIEYLILIIPILDFFFPAKGVEEVNRTLPIVYKSGLMVLFWLLLITSRFLKNVLGQDISRALIVLCVLSVIYMIIDPVNLNRNLSFFFRFFFWITVFLIFVDIGFREESVFRKPQIIIIILVAIVCVNVFRDYSNIGLHKGRNDFSISNYGYNLSRLLPLIFLCCKGMKRTFLLIVSFVVVFISFKRGAILTFALTAFFMILYNSIRFGRFSDKRNALIILSILSLVGYFLFTKYSVVFEHRLEDFESVETAGSGRGKMFILIFNHMVSNPINLVFGNGFLSSMDFFKQQLGVSIIAHSDLFEFFFDYGIIGIIIFILIIVSIIKTFRFYSSQRINYAVPVLGVFMIVVFSSLFTNLLFNPEAYYLAIPWGFLTGIKAKTKIFIQ